MTYGVVSMEPDKKTNTCVFVLDKGIFPQSEYDVFFSEDTYKQIRQGLVKARLNYTVSNLEAAVLDEDDEKNTITVRISAS